MYSDYFKNLKGSGCPLLCGYAVPTLLSAACLPCRPAIASLSAVSHHLNATYRSHPSRKIPPTKAQLTVK